jgi:hypothetical protein
MPRNKSRLQLALYARPKQPGTCHYALFVSPKSTKQKLANSATKHHVKNTVQNISGEVTQPWRYERLAISNVQLEPRLLIRIIIAKITSPDTLEGILGAARVYQIDDSNQAEAQSFSCLTWVQAALEELSRQGAVVGLGEWEEIQKKAAEYVERKRAAGRWNGDSKGEVGVPMLDLLNGREIFA